MGIIKLLIILGFNYKDFSVAFSLANISNIEYFVVRKIKLVEIYKELRGNGSCQVVVLYGLSRISKI
jgi:hypothetical protein